MSDHRTPTGAELRDLLRHPRFSISFRRLDTRIVIVVHCECGRKLDMLDSLDGAILLYWLADHDDEMFLTPDEIEALRDTVADAFGIPPGLRAAWDEIKEGES